MYYTNIKNEELQKFHKIIKVNASYNELDDGAFNTNQSRKIIPLFYTDMILVNENMSVIDNLVVLYSNANDLNDLYFQSKNENISFGIIYSDDFFDHVRLHFYDKISLFALPHFEFYLEKNDNGEMFTGNFKTDIYGNVIIKTFNAGEFKVIANGQEVTWEVSI